MTWQRLEGSAVDPEMTEGVSARLADPLWLLARQWQVGEFRGEDAASPVLIRGAIVAAPVTSYQPHNAPSGYSISRRDAGVPLETLAEQEPVGAGPAEVALRLEQGSALLHALARARLPIRFLDTLRVAYPFTDSIDDGLDPVGLARLRLLARRSVDAAAVLAAVADVGGDPAQLPEVLALTDANAARAATVIATWLDQEANLFRQIEPDDPTAWSARRLEYRFGLGAEIPDGTIELAAPEYPGGRLDWYHFDVESIPEGATTPVEVDGLVRKSLTSLPVPLELGGMPASRWWEFEDGDVDFGNLASGPEDLARTIIAAYKMVAGDDWFVLPCTLPSGSLARVTKLEVLDDFGQWTTVPATAVADGRDRPWKWFELDGDSGPASDLAPLLFLPPVVNTMEEGKPLEVVEFRRDEMANLAWGIELRVESAAGRPVDREAGTGPDPAGQAPSEDARWRYEVATDVWDNWVPLVPVRIDATSPQVVFRRGTIASVDGDPDANRAKGRILEPETVFLLNEEEVPSGGVRLTRRYQLARSADGDVHLWVGRRKRPSGGPLRRSPLRFDTLTGWEQPPPDLLGPEDVQ